MYSDDINITGYILNNPQIYKTLLNLPLPLPTRIFVPSHGVPHPHMMLSRPPHHGVPHHRMVLSRPPHHGVPHHRMMLSRPPYHDAPHHSDTQHLPHSSVLPHGGTEHTATRCSSGHCAPPAVSVFHADSHTRPPYLYHISRPHTCTSYLHLIHVPHTCTCSPSRPPYQSSHTQTPN